MVISEVESKYSEPKPIVDTNMMLIQCIRQRLQVFHYRLTTSAENLGVTPVDIMAIIALVCIDALLTFLIVSFLLYRYALSQGVILMR